MSDADAAPGLSDPARLAAVARHRDAGLSAEPALDNLAGLAATICRAPLAFVTLLDADRQILRARHGSDDTDTPLANAICAHAVDADALLVIPDLTCDPRTAANPLVTGEAALRFYAGAPLRDEAGRVLGTLCVIDHVARPDGLSDFEREALVSLAREAMCRLELLALVAARDAALAARADPAIARTVAAGRDAAAEAEWRRLFEAASEGFVIGEIVRDAEGRGVDWVYVDANRAWQDGAGQDIAQVRGRRVSEVLPGVDPAWISGPVSVVDSGQSLAFVREMPLARRWYDGRIFRIGPNRFAGLFLDATLRVTTERRLAALVTIGDALRDLTSAEEMTRFVAQVVGETLQASRAGFGRIDLGRQTIEMEPDWSARADIGSIAGMHRFADYGDLLNELIRGEPLVIDDVRTDPRTAADPAPMLAIQIGALVNMPVREQGRTVAAFFVHAEGARTWHSDELDFLRSAADRLEAAVVRLEVEQRRQVITEELSHRLKNTLAMVQAIATQTLKPVGDRSIVEAFDQRLTALAGAHDVLLRTRWTEADLGEVAEAVLAALSQSHRVDRSGPVVELSPRAVLAASLLLHELATNALKYGALSVPGGRVAIEWRVDTADGPPTLILDWREHGGPPATPPAHRGFGSRLIAMGLIGTGGVQLRYDTQGFSAIVTAPVAELVRA